MNLCFPAEGFVSPLWYDSMRRGCGARPQLVEGVQNYIKSMNFGYRVQLRSQGVAYINARGRFLDPHTLEALQPGGQTQTLTASQFVVAVGSRPRYLGTAVIF